MLFYRKSGVKNAIFLDFCAFYALKCVYFEAFCSFHQVIFASNTNFNTKNYTKTIPILIPVLLYTPMAASYQMLSANFVYLIISQIARKINVFSDIRNLIDQKNLRLSNLILHYFSVLYIELPWSVVQISDIICFVQDLIFLQCNAIMN